MKTLSRMMLLFLLLYSCRKDPQVPVITTSDVASISYTSAVAGGSITDAGGDPVIEKGICWSTGSAPEVSDNKLTASGDNGGFTCNLTGLSLNTTYFVRAYATNSAGTGYGNSVSFKTLKAAVAVLSTATVTSITASSAVTGGNVSDESGATVTERGVCWSTQSNPTVSNSKISNGAGAGNFSCSLSNLSPGTTYYVRAYAVNSEGTAYGNEISFTSEAVIPVLTTSALWGTTPVSVYTGGEISNTGGATITERGVCWNTSPSPLITDNKIQSGTGAGSFTAAIAGLLGNTTYYVRAYAKNSAGTGYGNELSFTTLPPVLPTLTTSAVSTITIDSFSGGGSITGNGGAVVTEKGICWNTSGNPTLNDSHTLDVSGTQSFTVSATAVQSNTLFYIRAYATNNQGTTYGNEVIARTYKGTITDVEGNTYYTLTIGTQTWMAENLRTSKYRNGDLIGTTSSPGLDISAEATPKYQWAYSGVEANAAEYGRLYTWFAVTDSRNICPAGWHVSTDGEWVTLETYMAANGYNFDGTTSVYSSDNNKLAKSLASAKSWKLVGFEGSAGNIDYPLYRNKSGFTALPAGGRSSNGTFFDLGGMASWWTSTEIGAAAWTRNIFYSNTRTNKVGNVKNEMAYSVRCVMD